MKPLLEPAIRASNTSTKATMEAIMGTNVEGCRMITAYGVGFLLVEREVCKGNVDDDRYKCSVVNVIRCPHSVDEPHQGR